MKHNLVTIANSLAVTTGIVYVVCAVLIVVVPDLAMTVAQSWFHGIDISRISSWNMTVGSFILGLITTVAFSWGIGYLFSYIYNFLTKK